MRRWTAALLALLLLVQLWVPAGAAEVTEELSAETETETPEQYGVFDLTWEAGQVTAQVTASGPCTLLVALYTEAGRLVSAGLKELEGGEETAVVPVAEEGRPAYFLLKAFLTDEGRAPLCDSYTCITYTKGYADFQKRSPSDYPYARVLDFSDYSNDRNENFAVLSDGVVRIYCSEYANALTVEETDTETVYVLGSANDAAKALQAGDRVYLENGVDSHTLLAETVEVNGTTVRITGTPAEDFRDFFDLIRMETDLSRWEDEYDIQLQSDSEAEFGNGISKEFSFVLSKYASLSGRIMAAYKTHVTFAYSKDDFGRDRYILRDKITASVTYTMAVTGTFGTGSTGDAANHGEPYEFTFCKSPKVPIGTTGLFFQVSMSIPMTLKVQGEGKIEGKIYSEATCVSDGFGGKQKANWSESPQSDVLVQGRFSMEMGMGCKLSLKLALPGDLLAVEVTPEFGAIVKAEPDPSADGEPTYDDLDHMCVVCLNGTVSPYARGDLQLSALSGKRKKALLKITLIEWEQKGNPFYCSLNEQMQLSFGWGKCPNRGWWQYFTVEDDLGNTLAGAKIVVAPLGDGKGWSSDVGEDACCLAPQEYLVEVSKDFDYYPESFEITVDSSRHHTVQLERIRNELEADPPAGELKIGVEYGVMYYQNGHLQGTYNYETSGDTGARIHEGHVPARIVPLIRSVALDPGYVYIGPRAFKDCVNLESVFLPTTIKTLKEGAFQYCSSLPSIDLSYLPQTTLLPSTFAYCTSLSAVRLPAGLEKIDSAFYGCTSLHSIDLTGVKQVDYLSFAESGLRSVTLPAGVTVGHGAFQNCAYLTSVTIPSGTIEATYAFAGCIALKNVDLGAVTKLGTAAFMDCTALEQITLPHTLTTIDGSAFSGCTSLKSITFPSSLDRTGYLTCEDCTALETAVIENGVSLIEGGTFYNCHNLRSVTIPASVTEIWQEAFYGCAQLTDVYYGGTPEQWDAISVSFGNEYLTTANIHFAE